MKRPLIIIALTINFLFNSSAQEIDLGVAQSLKIEAMHNLNRLKNFKSEVRDRKIYDRERESALGEFLEEQERWELLRERNISSYLKQKKAETMSDDGPEFREDQRQKNREQLAYERSRNIQIRTRKQAQSVAAEQQIDRLESQELGLSGTKPRYVFEKRDKNRWIGAGAKLMQGGAGGGGGTSSFAPPNNDFQYNQPINNDFPAADFQNNPQPYDDFTQPTFDGGYNGVPYDANFGAGNGADFNQVVPPPPPPPDFDF